MKPSMLSDPNDSGWHVVRQFVSSGFHATGRSKRTTVTIKKPKFVSSSHYGASEKMPCRVQLTVDDPTQPSLLDIDLTYFDKPQP
jgi:hypothetical protein